MHPHKWECEGFTLMFFTNSRHINFLIWLLLLMFLIWFLLLIKISFCEITHSFHIDIIIRGEGLVHESNNSRHLNVGLRPSQANRPSANISCYGQPQSSKRRSHQILWQAKKDLLSIVRRPRRAGEQNLWVKGWTLNGWRRCAACKMQAPTTKSVTGEKSHTNARCYECVSLISGMQYN